MSRYDYPSPLAVRPRGIRMIAMIAVTALAGWWVVGPDEPADLASALTDVRDA